MPLYWEKDESAGMILTMRSKKLKSHPGQISFPGGIQEPGEELHETCLREWEEEMGSPRSELEILGRFTDLDTRTGFHITSFIGLYTGEFRFRPNEEVETYFSVSLREFWERDFYAIDFFGNPQHRTYYFDLEDNGLLWGATCEIIIRFLKEFTGFERSPRLVQPNLSNPPFFNPKD